MEIDSPIYFYNRVDFVIAYWEKAHQLLAFLCQKSILIMIIHPYPLS